MTGDHLPEREEDIPESGTAQKKRREKAMPLEIGLDFGWWIFHEICWGRVPKIQKQRI